MHRLVRQLGIQLQIALQPGIRRQLDQRLHHQPGLQALQQDHQLHQQLVHRVPQIIIHVHRVLLDPMVVVVIVEEVVVVAVVIVVAVAVAAEAEAVADRPKKIE